MEETTTNGTDAANGDVEMKEEVPAEVSSSMRTKGRTLLFTVYRRRSIAYNKHQIQPIHNLHHKSSLRRYPSLPNTSPPSNLLHPQQAQHLQSLPQRTHDQDQCLHSHQRSLRSQSLTAVQRGSISTRMLRRICWKR